MLQGELDPHLESGTFSGEMVAEQILWSGASARSVEIVGMALERIDWPRDDPRWFGMLWRPLPGHRDLTEVEQADSRATFRLILERCDPNLRAPESRQTMLHEVIARDHGVGVSLATMSALVAALLERDAGALKSLRAKTPQITCALTLAEAARAIVRARVGERLTVAEERAAVRALRRFARRCYVVAVTDEVLARVGRPFPMEPVRTLDAVHIATAESLGEPPQLMAIVTRDIRVRENAAALGYAVE
jgi:predicted nucleic acid-binding protein